MLAFHRFDIPGCLRMITSRNDQFGVGQFSADQGKRLDHQLQALVSSPLAKSENAVRWTSAT